MTKPVTLRIGTTTRELVAHCFAISTFERKCERDRETDIDEMRDLLLESRRLLGLAASAMGGFHSGGKQS